MFINRSQSTDWKGINTVRSYLKTRTTVSEVISVCPPVVTRGEHVPKAAGAFKFKVTPFLFAECRHIVGSLAADEKHDAFSWPPVREQHTSQPFL